MVQPCRRSDLQCVRLGAGRRIVDSGVATPPSYMATDGAMGICWRSAGMDEPFADRAEWRGYSR